LSNGIPIEIWDTWLFYAVLVDLGDAVADELGVSMERVSLEMIYRGRSHFSVAYQKGLASDLVKYFAYAKNQDVGIVKLGMKTSCQANYFSFPWNSKKSLTIFFQQ